MLKIIKINKLILILVNFDYLKLFLLYYLINKNIFKLI
jgi:hypothetical protein